jgi:transcriptional regulator with XRE-family HTH domain
MIGAVDFYGWLRRELAARGWRAADLARAAGLKVQVVAKWLYADPVKRVTPSPASCRLIAKVLDVDPDRVLAAAGHRPVEPGESDRPASPFEGEIRYRVRRYERLLRRIPERHRGTILPFLDDVEQAVERLLTRLLQHESHGDGKPPALQSGASVATDI